MMFAAFVFVNLHSTISADARPIVAVEPESVVPPLGSVHVMSVSVHGDGGPSSATVYVPNTKTNDLMFGRAPSESSSRKKFVGSQEGSNSKFSGSFGIASLRILIVPGGMTASGCRLLFTAPEESPSILCSLIEIDAPGKSLAPRFVPHPPG